MHKLRISGGWESFGMKFAPEGSWGGLFYRPRHVYSYPSFIPHSGAQRPKANSRSQVGSGWGAYLSGSRGYHPNQPQTGGFKNGPASHRQCLGPEQGTGGWKIHSAVSDPAINHPPVVWRVAPAERPLQKPLSIEKMAEKKIYYFFSFLSFFPATTG